MHTGSHFFNPRIWKDGRERFISWLSEEEANTKKGNDGEGMIQDVKRRQGSFNGPLNPKLWNQKRRKQS